MCPVWNMHPSIQHTPHHADQFQHPTASHVHLPDQCTAAYPSVMIRFMTPPQYAWTLLMVPEMQHQNPLMLSDHQMTMRIFRQYLWMMNIGQQRWFQKEHSAYMRMDYPITCVHTHVLMDQMAQPRI